MLTMGRVSSGVLIGRETELDVLIEAAGAAAQGGPSALVISGEPGIGKTRLLRELANWGQDHGAETVVGGCIPMSGGTLPYAPVVAALRQVLARTDQQRVASLPPTTVHELGRLLPELRAPEHGRATDTDQTGLFDAILALLRAHSRATPLIFVIEDVHWSDASTRDLVTYLLNMVEDERVLFLCSLRTGELDPSHPVPTWIQGLAASRMADIVELQPLSRDETRRQIREIAGPGVRDAVIEELFARSEGNPFFVEELLQAALRGAEELPPSLRELLVSRIRALSPEAIEIVKAISVDGPVVSHELLVGATGVADKEITPLLQGAIDRHLLVRTEDDGYSFRHALVRETIYGRILPGERRTLHRAFAQALELNGGAPGASPHSGRLARHWQEAGEHRRALAHALAAATDAERSYASSEALQHYNHALLMWERVEKPEEAAGTTKVALLERAAEAAQRTMHPEQAVGFYEDAIGLVDPVTDPGRAATLRSSLAYVMGGHLLDDEAAEPLLREAQALVEDLPPTIEKARVLGNLADDLNIAGQMEEGFAMAEKAVAIAREVGDVAQECRALNTLGLAYDLKDPDTALGYLTDALKLARELGDGQLLGRISANFSDALYRANRAEDAVIFALAAIDELAEMGDESFEGFLRCNAAEFLISLGRWDEAEMIIDPLLTASSLLDRVFSGWVLTEIDVARGRFEQASARIATLERNMSHMRDPQHQDPITLAKVSLALWERRRDDASDLVQDVLTTFKQDERSIARLCVLGLRVEADRAARARAGGSDNVEQQALERGAALEDRCAAVVAGSKVPEVKALGQLAVAEASRLRDTTEPELWAKGLQASDELNYGYQGAYARYRFGESLLARGERVEAGRVLSEALEATTDMGAVPLRLEIEGLGRRARLTLAAETGSDQPSGVLSGVLSPVPAENLGLTKREIEVLRSLSEGLTNKQIAEALFISPKTASIHVSSILAKLGVSSRTEAARRAYDSGLLDLSEKI